MKLVVLGLSLSSSWGNGHATTFRALLKAFAARGHDVLFLERDVPWYARAPRPRRARLTAASPSTPTSTTSSAGASEIARADAVIVGSYVPEGVAVGRWVQASREGVTAFYDIDTPVTLAKLERGDDEYLSPELIPGYDLYLSFTGGPTLDRLEQRLRLARRPRALLLGRSAELYAPARRAEALGPLLSRHLQRRPPADAGAAADRARARAAGAALRRRRPAISGDIDWPANVERIEHLPPAEHAAFYSAAASP